MKKRKLLAILAALTVTAGMLFGCSATVDLSDASSDKKETSEAVEEPEEETAGKEAEKYEKESDAEDVSEEASDEVTGDITYEIKSISYETEIDNFDGRTDILEITDDGHKKLKDAVDKWFEDYRANFEKNCKEFEKEAEETKKMAEEENSNSDDAGGYYPQYSLDYSASVSRADDVMLSVVLTEYSFMGGAHGGTYIYGVNFDTQTGDVIENSEFNDSADSVKDYILKCIDGSDDDAKEMLFPEWKDGVDSRFADGMKEGTFWFDGRGMTYAFQQYDIAPYAAGIITFDIPYSDMEGFPEKYVADGSFYTVSIPNYGFINYIDVDGDGKEEKVSLETNTDEDTYYAKFTLNVGDRQLKIDEDSYYYYCDPTFVHSSEGDYIMIVFTSDNDYNTIHMYEVGDDIREIDDVDGSFREIRDGKALISQRHDAFGTWSVIKEYTYGPKGFHTDEKIDRINNDPRENKYATGIKLLKDLEYSEKSGDYSHTKELEKGSVIYPVSDSGSEIGFVTEDGEEGFFEYDHDKDRGAREVNGVEEFDMFDDMPYAG